MCFKPTVKKLTISLVLRRETKSNYDGIVENIRGTSFPKAEAGDVRLETVHVPLLKNNLQCQYLI
jgi:hypothetical protein